MSKSLLEAFKTAFGLHGNSGEHGINMPLLDPCYLHLGCGGNVLDGFLNVDFIPDDLRVLGWNLLEPWPSELTDRVDGIFTEDLFEHFFYDEQAYLLCQANRCLRMGSVIRLLMPSFAKVIDCYLKRNDSNAFWRDFYACETPADITNAALRHSGHAWLHDNESIAHLALKFGFKSVMTTCKDSLDARMSEVNLRDETNSLSFATDLVKARSIQCHRVSPSEISNAVLIERDSKGAFYKSITNDPMILYVFPEVPACDIVLINARVLNLLPSYEHNIVKFYFALDEACSFYNDRSLLGAKINNFVQGDIIRSRIKSSDSVSMIRVDPCDMENTIFYVSDLEVFYFG